ncbi:hypothetical protein D770_05370 [Flammeovirgaceae bacterium 311]|nr:hypothetical protein D770_05370 [Flammeovirgaceae bacterium 311]
MKFLISILLLLTSSFVCYSQGKESIISNWDKIILQDSYWGWGQYGNEFQLHRENYLLTSTNHEDSLTRSINPELINELLGSLKSDTLIQYDPLRMFGRDSLWLIHNAQQLWISYLGKRDESAEIDSIAVNTIRNYEKVKMAAWRMQGSHWTDDYPFTHLAVISGDDTLHIYSEGQYPYMMPWKVADQYVYNARIPSLIAQLLPDNLKTNKSRLAGERFEYFLIDKIHGQIRDSIQFIKAKRRYPRKFDILKRKFSILDAQLTTMSSIEWGGWFGSPCLELELRDKRQPKNIKISVVLGRRGKLHSIRPFLSKWESLIQQLNDNPVYRYTVQHETSYGEIHFVNRRSLSGEAKRAFLEDVKEKGQKKGNFRGRLKGAIFYELEEAMGEKRSFSRWIFLKDGTLVLWQFNGGFLMNLPSEIIAEKGYVCRIISAEDIRKAKPED